MDKTEFMELLGNYATKEDLQSAVSKHDEKKEHSYTDDEIIQHFKDCKESCCEITKLRQEIEEDGIALGMLLSDL